MKIMFIPTSYPDKENPVKNIYIYEQAKALAELGHQIIVLHVQKQPSRALFRLMNTSIQYNDDGFAVRYSKKMRTFWEGRFPGLNRGSFVRSMKQLFSAALKKEGCPDVIYSHFSCWAGYAAVELGRKYNIPVVNIEHYNKFINNRADEDMIRGLRYVIDNAAHNIAVSGNLQRAMKRLTQTQREITVVPNMINDGFVYCQPVKHDGFVFSAVANLNKGKRFDLLIRSFCEAFAPEEDVRLLIGGSGEMKRTLLQLIKENQREHQIQLLGRLNRAQTIQLYQNCDCFALPSAFETFGIVWREAMAVGRPVITTDHGGWSPEEWSEDFGIMIPVDDQCALTDALKTVRDSYSSYDLEKISQFATENYSARIIGQRLESLLLQAVGSVRT